MKSSPSRAPGRLRSWLVKSKRHILALRLALKDPRTPRLARWLIGIAIAYAVSPIDLIPDFIPVLGWLDDLILVPLLLWLAVRLIPGKVWRECQEKATLNADSSTTEGSGDMSMRTSSTRGSKK